MPKLTNMALQDRLVQITQESQPRLGDTDHHNPAILGRTIALDQAALFEFVEKAGDVWGARDQPASQVQRGNLAGMLAAQKPPGVVLLGCQIMLAKELVLQRTQPIVGAPQVQEDLLFQGVESLAVARLSRLHCHHASHYSQSDN